MTTGAPFGTKAARRFALGLLVLGFLVAASPRLLDTTAGGGPLRSEKRQVVAPRTVAVTYRVSLPGLSERARQVAIWVPLPRETSAQHVEEVKIASALPHRVLRDPVYGNRFLCLEAIGVLPDSLGVALEYIIRREGLEVRDAAERGTLPERTGDLARFLRPDRLVPTDGVVAERAARVLSGVGGGSLEKARLLYEEVLRTMRYDKSGDGWGRGDAVYACEIGAGNCTDFHSLFIGMARSAGIPSRFVMGLPLPADASEGEILGYHCWAEFHDERLGWVPLDASEAWKRPEEREFLFGGLDPNRVEFTIGRDIPLIPVDKAEGVILNYSIYPHVVVDGAAYDGAVLRMSFRNLTG